MSKAGNERTEVVIVDGADVPFEQARRALLMGIQAVAEERDERFDVIEEARLLRFKINNLTANLLEDHKSDKVVALPVGTAHAQSARIALERAMIEAGESEDGYVAISSAIHWSEDNSAQARCRARFVITKNGEVMLLRSRTLIKEAQQNEPGRLERKEWLSPKTIEGLIPFIEKGFDFEIFLDEVLETLG